MTASPSAACRAFEEVLLSRMDETGPDGPTPMTGGHADDCGDCRELVGILGATSETLRALAPPRPPIRLLRALAAPPSDFALRRESAAYLDELAPGALLLPEPSRELMGRLHYLPTRAQAGLAGPGAPRPIWRRWLGDWRITVAAAYAAALVIVMLLGVDPMSAARGAASSLTAAGERAVEDARRTALARLDAAARAEAEKPLPERLDYRIYRAFATGKARATALAEVAFENVFGGAAESTPAPDTSSSTPPAEKAEPRRSRRPAPTPEPDGKVLRS
ncbi:MAG: hypothetical protein ACHQPI_09330 [Thermoanaerobaculia bacterium]